MHFGGFASNYLRREYFFDVHPPLGKLLIAAVGWLFGYDGSFTFATIGQSYAASSAPYVALRMFMVLLGTGSIALSCATLLEMGFSLLGTAVCGLLLAFDNALVTQSRLILLDSILLFFISASVYCWVKFRQQRYAPFRAEWWIWLALTGASIGAATSVKMVGLFTVAAIGVVTIIDLWELADWRRHHSDRLIARHFTCRALGLVAVPIFIYLASYWVHFAVLNRTGPGDSFMSADFQAGLKGNQMHENSRQVFYGHTIRLRSRLEAVYLHSHLHNYPRIHDDGKVSSEGQQVTGYTAEDKNNLWKLLPADNSSTVSLDARVPVRSGDAIRLLHVSTGKVLYTHDVASPLTRTNMEVTVVDPEDAEKYESTIWLVDIKTGGSELKALSCQLRLVHKTHQVALTNWQQPLPKWGFEQREINGDKRGLDENSNWIVWEVHDPLTEEEKRALKAKPRPKMSFMQKFVELQQAQVRHNAALIDNHPFKSDPLTWPFVIRGVSYWDKQKAARIYLLGNPIAWYICLAGLIAATTVFLHNLYMARRGKTRAAEPSQFQARFLYRAGFLLLSWALHYFPFFTMARTLYLHHYLPAYVMSAMLTAAVVDYNLRRASRPALLHATLVVLGIAVVATFVYFIPITYGTRISTAALEGRKWASTWDWP